MKEGVELDGQLRVGDRSRNGLIVHQLGPTASSGERFQSVGNQLVRQALLSRPWWLVIGE